MAMNIVSVSTSFQTWTAHFQRSFNIGSVSTIKLVENSANREYNPKKLAILGSEQVSGGL